MFISIDYSDLFKITKNIQVLFTDIEGLRSLLGEQVKDLLRVGRPVRGSQIFISTAKLRSDVIQRNSLITITLKGRKQ